MNSAGGVNSGWEVNSGRQEQFLKRAKFWLCEILLHFLLLFPYGLRSAMLSLTRILRAWIDSTISA